MKDKKYVITITRQFGSLGRPIAKLMAEQLGIEYYDRDIVDQAAKQLKLPASVVDEEEESAKKIFKNPFSRMVLPLGGGTNRLSNCLIIKENSSAILDVQGKDQENTKCYMVLHSMKSSTKFALHRFMGNHSWNIISEENFFSQ